MGERLDDNQLMLAARSGDRRAFEILVSRYQPHLLRYASRTVGDHRADDVLQHVWIRAWRWIIDPEKELPENVKPWLYRITHNQALNHLRDHPVDSDSADALAESTGISCGRDVYHQAETNARTRDMLDGLNQLPQRQAQALIMHAAHGLSHEEIAQQTGDNPHAVRGLIFRARAQMREKSLAWAGALLPFPWVHKMMSRWQQHGLSPAEQAAAGASGAAGSGAVAALSSGGSALVASSTSKIALVVATGTVAVGGGAAVKKAVESPPPVVAKAAVAQNNKTAGRGASSSVVPRSSAAGTGVQALVAGPTKRQGVGPVKGSSKNPAQLLQAALPPEEGRARKPNKENQWSPAPVENEDAPKSQKPRWNGDQPKKPRWGGGDDSLQTMSEAPQKPRWNGSKDKPQKPRWDEEQTQKPRWNGSGEQIQKPRWSKEKPQRPSWEIKQNDDQQGSGGERAKDKARWSNPD